MKRILSLILVLMLILSLGGTAFADNTQSRAVIGADLTAEQVVQVYSAFGVQQGTVPQPLVTNAEERQYLEGYVDSSIIGARSISCVYVELLGSGAVVVVEGALAERPPDLVNDGNGVFALANVDSDCYHTCHLSGMGLAAPG